MKRLSIAVWAAVLALPVAAALAAGDFDVKIDLENLSGQDKIAWPVVLRVCHAFGRNLPVGSIHPKGFHVYGPDGKELPHDVETIAPDDWPGSDELIFVVPSMKAGAKLTVRVTNTDQPSEMRMPLDLVGNPHNLIANGGFEAGNGKGVQSWQGAAKLDSKVKRSGKSALLMEGTRRIRAKYTGKLPLHPGSPYYAGVWCKTQNVARHGVAAGAGAHFRVAGFAKVWGRGATLKPQCYTRDWNKSRFFARYGIEYTDWGVDRDCVLAAADQATIEIGLDQKHNWCMSDGHGKWWLDDFVLIEQPKATVRFDLALAPQMTDGVFLFTRPSNMPMGGEPSKKFPTPWAARPFTHERLGTIDRWGLKGQRVPYVIGLYHTKPMEKVSVTVPGKAVTGEGGKVPLELLEWTAGYVNSPHHLMADYSGPVDFAGPDGVRYFVATFRVPRDARAGRYAGKIVLAAGGKTLREVPITLRVQDMVQPVLKDRYIGMIMQASPIRYNADTLAVYARSGWSCVTVFGAFLRYSPADAAGRRHVDLDALRKNMALAQSHGLAAVCLYSDLQLDQKPRGPGAMHRCALRVPQVATAWKRAGTARDAYKAKRDAARKDRDDKLKAAAEAEALARYKTLEQAAMDVEKAEYFRLLRELDGECRRHPDWPVVIHMNWDEPGGGHPRMGWTNECLPEALTTLDAGFRALPRVLKYYNMPALDDPCDFSGPEVYAAVKAKGKKVGLAASSKQGECARYQPGIWVAASGASYMHAWHLAGAGMMRVVDRKALRSISMVAAGEGLDDLKAYLLLTGEIDRAAKSGDAKAKAAAAKARAYIDGVLARWNGDTAQASANPPYFGWACTWGYERFYEKWQEQMARHAAAIRGVKWIE